MKQIQCLILLLFICNSAMAMHFDIFEKAAAPLGIDATFLRAICEIESRCNPWAVNINGEGFQPKSKADALMLIKSTQNRPWLLKLQYAGDEPTRSFFPSEAAARSALKSIRKANKALGIVPPNTTEIRWLDTRSTDIGLMQINYLFHGRHFESMDQLFDPEVNVGYAAKYLSDLLQQHGNWSKAVAHYHSNTLKYQTLYLSQFWPVYKKLVLEAN